MNPITHYIASRYATIAPVIETYPLHKLYDPRIQAKITGISTFYLVPKNSIPANLNMLERVSMLKPGTPLKEQIQNY